jgi:hypothetical protein
VNAVAVNPRHVSAVELGVGRCSKHYVILASGRKVQVSHSFGVKILDRLTDKLDRVAPLPWKAVQSKPKRRARK